ncbi:hypothetical protein FF1_027949 [Malus domestica]
MSVGRKRLQYNSSLNPSLAPAKGNIIVDSWTTLTLLPEDLYNKLELMLQDLIDYQSSGNHCGFHWCRCEVTSFQHFLKSVNGCSLLSFQTHSLRNRGLWQHGKRSIQF